MSSTYVGIAFPPQPTEAKHHYLQELDTVAVDPYFRKLFSWKHLDLNRVSSRNRLRTGILQGVLS